MQGGSLILAARALAWAGGGTTQGAASAAANAVATRSPLAIAP